METIYFDESGYTGGDLVNSHQKTFVLVSLRMNEDEAAELKGGFFSAVKAQELKFSSIKKNPKQLSAAIEFLAHIANKHSEQLLINIAHKEFV